MNPIAIPPNAAAMIEALRGVGYTLQTAIADVIDNSITAGAGEVLVDFNWSGRDSWIRIADNGCGMSAEELTEAMRLGARHPLAERPEHDLGRFGLGLKTASFSQCRRVTVCSRKDGTDTVRRWDLDWIAEHPADWHLLTEPADGSEQRLARHAMAEEGTVVLWELLDRVVTGEHLGETIREQDFLDAIDKVEQHLAMVFHRYLEDRTISLMLNGREVRPWDPFLSGNPETRRTPEEIIPSRSGILRVRGYVLPHRDRFASDEDYERAGGPAGWGGQQGFYVYRNRRLLVAGGWLGLGTKRAWTKDQAHRLARIRIDLPNTADEEWKIDIRKSMARPPVEVRERLVSIAEDVRQTARRVFAHRGDYGAGPRNDNLLRAWQNTDSGGRIRYRIDRGHPAVRAVLDRAGPLLPDLQAMLRIIEETVPVQRIWLDTVEQDATQIGEFTDTAPEEISEVLGTLYRDLVRRVGFPPAAARRRLLETVPFQRFPDLVNALPDNP